MTARWVLCCDGAAYFDDGTPDYHTFQCNKTLPDKAADGYKGLADLLNDARLLGWRIGPKGDVMCPKCSAPDPSTLRLIESFDATRRVIP